MLDVNEFKRERICPEPEQTFTLLLLMAALIQANYTVVAPEASVNIVDVVMPKREIVTQLPALERPDAPAEPPALPTFADKMIVTSQAPTSAVFEITAIDTTVDINLSPAGDYLPLVKVAPQYPRVAVQKGLEAVVVVAFTVTRTGTTRDVTVLQAATLDGAPTRIFNSAAIKAAEGLKYKPRIEDGVAQEVHGVQNRFIFELDQ